ncbi:hypothetical protein M4578_12745 [Salipiger sp. P9]|nr:hypothetical protein [Salipiger pentaromativorans]MCR8548699.1 hypothetical protein [Salipiger pentaromativorans]
MAAPAVAQDGFSIDYDRLFRDHAAALHSPAPGVEHLELPGPVIVERRAGQVRATDQSGWGAAGCALQRLLIAAAAVTACPALYTPEQRDRVAAQLLRGVDFFAENTVPPMSDSARRTAMMAALAATRARLALSCGPRDSEALAFASHIAEDRSWQRFARIFEQPRLPVTDPCP